MECGVALWSRSTKHIPRRQKVVVVASFPKSGVGSGSPAMHRACDASGMSSYSRLHFLWCVSIACCHEVKTSSLSKVRCSSPPRNPVYTRSVDPSTLTFSLSSHRHSYISLLCRSESFSPLIINYSPWSTCEYSTCDISLLSWLTKVPKTMIQCQFNNLTNPVTSSRGFYFLCTVFDKIQH
jgi:hypothetical protein